MRSIVRAKNYQVECRRPARRKEGLKTTLWRLKFGTTWSVPVVEFAEGEPNTTTLLLADKGRQAVAATVRELLQKGQRVLAVDPFYVGEVRIEEKDYLFAPLLATVGDRTLGLQASEIAAVARWAQEGRRLGPVTILAIGPRVSVDGADDRGMRGLGHRKNRALGGLWQPQGTDRGQEFIHSIAGIVLLRTSRSSTLRSSSRCCPSTGHASLAECSRCTGRGEKGRRCLAGPARWIWCWCARSRAVDGGGVPECCGAAKATFRRGNLPGPGGRRR